MPAETDRASFYEEHRDDEDLWGDPEPAPVATPLPRQGLTVTITVRFSAEEAEAIRHVARERHTTYSEVVREAVAAYARRGQPTTTTVRFSPTGEPQPHSEGTSVHLRREGDAPDYTDAVAVRRCVSPS